MKKQFVALLTALSMTALLGMVMLVIGVVAFFNSQGAPLANNKAQAAQVALSPQEQIIQLKEQVAQYQAREKEYQAREQQYNQQLAQANAQAIAAQQQVQQIQQLLSALQQRGLITVTREGQIFINR
ncbi:MAG: hypothetical protein OHK0031_17860 [Anaerolineales bacterium]